MVRLLYVGNKFTGLGKLTVVSHKRSYILNYRARFFFSLASGVPRRFNNKVNNKNNERRWIYNVIPTLSRLG